MGDGGGSGVGGVGVGSGGVGSDGGGVGFFPRLLGFWGKGSMIHSHPALSIFIFKVEVSWHTGQDQSTEAQRAETTVAECSLTSFV